MKKEIVENKEEVVEVKAEKFEEVEVYQEVETKKKEVRTDSYFDGGLIELIGWRILAFLITIVTLGIAAPWGICMLYSYQIKHTVYNGKRLKFEGTGGDLFVNKFKWFLLTIITFGIYVLFIPIKKTKWVISNIHFEDEEFIKEESFFDGKTIQLIGINLLCNFLNIITLGLVAPFTVCFKLRWINKHTVINRKKLVFNGKAIGLFGKQILWNFLTIITFGIYGLWVPIKRLKWQSKNIHIKVVGEVEKKDKSLFIVIPIVIIGIVILIALLPGMIKAITYSFDAGIHGIEDVFESFEAGFGGAEGGTRNNSKITESVMASASSAKGNKGTSVSKKNTSSFKNTPSSSNKKNTSKTSTSTSSKGTSTTTTKKTGYPTLKEIAGDYGINIKEDRYENGSSTKTETLDASGIETISVSGGKIKYLSYTMNYNVSTGYASASSSKGVIEAYFKYKNGKVSVNMRESIYNDNGVVVKVERAISGNKIS